MRGIPVQHDGIMHRLNDLICTPARCHARTSRSGVHISAHQFSIFALISSLTFRVKSSFSSAEPRKLDGSGKLQCSRVVTPGKIGHRSALASSHTVIT